MKTKQIITIAAAGLTALAVVTLKTGRGTLRCVDGVPTEETAQMVGDQLDFGRAVAGAMHPPPTSR